MLVETLDRDTCETLCARARRAGERLVRCDQNASGWELNPRFKDDQSQFKEPEQFDMAKRLGPLPIGYVFCSFAAESP